MLGCVLAAGRLIEPSAIYLDQRIRPQYQSIGLPGRDCRSLGSGQRLRDFPGLGSIHFGFESPFIDIRALCRESDTRRLQHRLARGAVGGKDQTAPRNPCHIGLAP